MITQECIPFSATTLSTNVDYNTILPKQHHLLNSTNKKNIPSVRSLPAVRCGGIHREEYERMIFFRVAYTRWRGTTSHYYMKEREVPSLNMDTRRERRFHTIMYLHCSAIVIVELLYLPLYCSRGVNTSSTHAALAVRYSILGWMTHFFSAIAIFRCIYKITINTHK